jgi:hypothetical protein
MQIGKITAPTAGYPDLLGGMPRLLQQQHPLPALAGDGRAHQARRTGAEYDDVVDV